MPESSNTVVFRGDSADFIQAVAKNIAKTKEMEKELGKLTGQTKKLTKEEKEFARATKKAYDDIRGPQERHLTRLRALKKLVQDNKITQKEYGRAVEQSQVKLDRAGRSGRDAFGARAIADLKGYAMGFVGVSAAVGLVTRALREQQQVREEIAEKQRAARFNLGMLGQLAGGDPKRLAKMEQTALFLRGEGAVPSIAEGGRAAFELGSANWLKEAKFTARVSRLAGPEGMAPVIEKARKLQTAMPDEATGTLKDILSKASAAAGPVSGVGISSILEATAGAAGSAPAMGVSDEELFAMVSIVSQAYRPAEASTAVSRMLDQLAVKRPELKGKSAVEMMKTLRAEKMTEKKLKTLLQIRGIRAYRLLQPDVLQGRLGEVEEGQRTGAIERDIEVLKTSRLITSAWERERAEGQREVAGVDLGIATNRVKGGTAELQGRALGRGNEGLSWGIGAAGLAAETVVGPETLLSKRFDEGVLPYAGGGATQLMGVFSMAANRLLEAAEALSAATHARPVQQSNN